MAHGTQGDTLHGPLQSGRQGAEGAGQAAGPSPGVQACGQEHFPVAALPPLHQACSQQVVATGSLLQLPLGGGWGRPWQELSVFYGT